MAGARGGRSPETVPIQSVSLELFIAISVACGDICPRAAGPACRRGSGRLKGSYRDLCRNREIITSQPVCFRVVGVP